MGNPRSWWQFVVLKHHILRHFSLLIYAVSETGLFSMGIGNTLSHTFKHLLRNFVLPFFNEADCFIVNMEWTPLAIRMHNVTYIS